ncbi:MULTISPECIES: glycosyltransferase family 2 protein [unclassified Pedobacter]|uniref:glycosyltransferase family 2 protein n=1 Tax=unclassified Pedobacter TaxID=2628915 RepID=UPI001E400BEA|nr:MULTISPECIES: glycosyltransferase family 2 protein [unclassified Pedobacter]
MLNLPLISIAVCTYNGQIHIHEQLQSLVNQDYINKEIIIVDDRSTDGTLEILKDYEQKFSFVKIYQNPTNLGYIKNFEKAISYCNGDYIALSDQDDIWDLQKLSKLKDSFNQASLLIYHNSALVDEKGKLLNKTLSQTIGYLDNNDGRNLLLNNCIAGHSIMFKRDLRNKILPFPNTIPHDHWLAYVATVTGQIQYLPETLVEYRQHNFSLTFTEHSKDNQRLVVENNDKKAEKLNLNNLRIKHLITIKSFYENDNKELKFINKIIRLLVNKPKNGFAFSLFFFLACHQQRLFKLYHKSFLSTLILIIKECKS